MASLVSCIMPTADRETFIPLAIDYFLRQDYPDKELIIVDDGINLIEQIIPANSQIRYIKLEKKEKVGQKRNYACQAANGDIIVHMDDDDWYASDWISKQVSVLEATKADICGLSKLYFYNPIANNAWQYIYPDNAAHWVAGATMAYKKSFWEQYPFRNMQVGEDNQFVWNFKACVAKLDHLTGFISILHTKNTSPKHTASSRWQLCPIKNIETILKSDILNYKSR